MIIPVGKPVKNNMIIIIKISLNVKTGKRDILFL